MTAPNLMILTSHDLGRHLSCYGRETVASPNLDRLAGEGVLLERCFSTSPICGPSRASLVTGLHPQNHGAYGLMSPPWNWRWQPGVRHMGERLKEAGYVTAVGGVRHEVAREQRPEFDAVLTQEELPARELAEAAEGFLRERAGDGRPFYLQLGFFETHTPFNYGAAVPDREKGVWIPPQVAADAEAEAHLAGLQGAVRALDDGVGHLENLLRELELWDNTLVVFVADHGIEVPGAKWYLYDPGIEVAAMIRWPAGGISGGRRLCGLTSHVDWLRTLFSLAGLPLEDETDGMDLSEYLRGGPDPTIGRCLYALQHGYEIRAARTERYKWIRNFEMQPCFQRPAPMAQPHVKGKIAPLTELYDLEADPLEFVNLAESPEHAEIRRELDDALLAHLRRHGDLILNSPMPTPYWQQAHADLPREVREEYARG